jgi:oxygen-independent coproporphyrinogen-3 oxidase
MNKRKFSRLYIHIPFCASKCDYCAFYSITNFSEDLIQKYFCQIEKEFKKNNILCSDLKSVYIGGGTPTILNTANLLKLFELIQKYFSFAENPEISIEANPSTLNEEKIIAISSFSNRVSMGIQTFNETLRHRIGRHEPLVDIVGITDIFQKHGVSNISFDLIYSLPGQNLEMWSNDLKQALRLPLKHLSAYSLTYEENTVLTEKYTSIVKEKNTLDLEAEMWTELHSILKKNNIEQYEISNYSVRGFECQHNLDIWYGDTFLACGPAGASFDGSDRWTNPPDLKKWLKTEKAEYDIIDNDYRAKEIFIMGLRTVSGWNHELFESRTGLSYMKWSKSLEYLVSIDLLLFDTATLAVRCSSKGLILWNEIAELILFA